ncbi:LPXTG cell wall anchor domain-containing protein [Isoptericola sp. NPDC057559]|uniref:DUF7507 domain-containing protein n=1 Tax=Isoptericola sp. NPDC057559 TaxID=3346168 RepID=UPI0036998702
MDETFTGATADPLFSAYGSACLTGATEGNPTAGAHPLAGCDPSRTVNSPPLGGAPDGYLQLTDASNDQSGAVLFDTPIPAEQGLVVRFEQWQYGTTTADPAPADGIAFFLVDGEAELVAPGAFGGSLGYAQKRPDGIPTNDIVPGVVGGYLGIGLDVLGNYFGDWEDRGLGCPADQASPAGTGFRIPEPEKITVRGPVGTDTTQGYCFLTSTAENLDDPTATSWPSTLPVTLQGTTTSLPGGIGAGEAAALLEGDKRTVEVTVSPEPNPRVTVSIAGADGDLQQVLDIPAPEPVPETYKFGFSASTGLFTDVHLIRNVVLESVDPSPILTLTKVADDPGPYRLGDTVTYTYTVTNSGLAPVTDLEVVDDRIPDVVCQSTTLGALGDAPANETTCRGEYTVTAEDVQAGEVVNTATASGDDGGAISPPVTETVPVVEPSPSPSPSPSPTPTPTTSPSPSPSPSVSPSPSPSASAPVVPPPTGGPTTGPSFPGELPRTGADLGPVAVLAAVLLALGALGVGVARRRRS